MITRIKHPDIEAKKAVEIISGYIVAYGVMPTGNRPVIYEDGTEKYAIFLKYSNTSYLFSIERA